MHCSTSPCPQNLCIRLKGWKVLNEHGIFTILQPSSYAKWSETTDWFLLNFSYVAMNTIIPTKLNYRSILKFLFTCFWEAWQFLLRRPILSIIQPNERTGCENWLGTIDQTNSNLMKIMVQWWRISNSLNCSNRASPGLDVISELKTRRTLYPVPQSLAGRVYKNVNGLISVVSWTVKLSYLCLPIPTPGPTILQITVSGRSQHQVQGCNHFPFWGSWKGEYGCVKMHCFHSVGSPQDCAG